MAVPLTLDADAIGSAFRMAECEIETKCAAIVRPLRCNPKSAHIRRHRAGEAIKLSK